MFKIEETIIDVNETTFVNAFIVTLDNNTIGCFGSKKEANEFINSLNK